MLVDKLNELYFSKDYKTNEVNNYVGSIISEENFKKSFINMWSEITTIVNEKSIQKVLPVNKIFTGLPCSQAFNALPHFLPRLIVLDSQTLIIRLSHKKV